MKIQIKATQKELNNPAKLGLAFSQVIEQINPSIRDYLVKSISPIKTEIVEPVILEVLKQWELSYKDQTEKMIDDIGAVFDAATKKSLGDIDLEKGEKEVSAAKFGDKYAFFLERTNAHIELVRKYCRVLSEVKGFEKLSSIGETHDQSKFSTPEIESYVWLTWDKKCKSEKVEFELPEEIKRDIIKATEHHILNNRHHPEFHQSNKHALLNDKNRDGIPSKTVDATKMPNLDLAEMVADWLAMSEELGTSAKDWADKNINTRWKFTEEQSSLIYTLIKKGESYGKKR